MPKVSGDLLIHDWSDGNSFGRAVRVARLKSIEGGTKADPVPPLLEPAIIRVTSDTLVMVGIEIEGDEHGNVADHVHGWMVRPFARNAEIADQCYATNSSFLRLLSGHLQQV